MNKYEILKTYFGYDSFRGAQEILIDSILSRERRAGDHAHGSGQVSLLPDPGADVGWDHSGDIASDLLNEGPGGELKPGGDPCGLFKQLSDSRPVPEGPGLCQTGKISHHLCGSRTAFDAGIPGFFQKCADLHGGGG